MSLSRDLRRSAQSHQYQDGDAQPAPTLPVVDLQGPKGNLALCEEDEEDAFWFMDDDE